MAASSRSGRRLLFVHAHPDDESIGTGATMAAYAAAGAHVALVTCTLGELGEIIPLDLAHLAWDREDRLGEHRIGELAAACAALGVSDHRFLGGPGRWRDSGMMGEPSNDRPGCFWRADLDEAAGELAAVIREVRPHAVVTYDARGFYGHPDHIQAHRVTLRACQVAGGPGSGAGRPPWQVPKIYATAMPRSVLAEAIRLAPVRGRWPGAGQGRPGFTEAATVGDLPFGVDDGEVTTEIDASGHLGAKLAAMSAHATQITVDPPYYALSDNVGQRALGHEYYTLLAGPAARQRAGGRAGREREHDLLAGL